MERRRGDGLGSLLLSLPLCALAAACSTEAPEPSIETDEPTPPSVVLIVVDTLRRDHLSCYGYERATSPHIDGLAARGVRYADSLSQAPWTTPSVGALFTSRYPTTLGIENDRSALPRDYVTLPEVLREHGYTTAAVISHTFCSSKWNFDQGFDFFDESNILGHEGVSSAGVSDVALEFLAERGDGPFFLWLHYFDPHFAYNAHPEHDFLAADYAGPVRDGMPFSRLTKLREDLEPADLQRIRDLYDSEIAYTDAQIGRVLDALEASGELERSLVILTADHGEEFLDHQRLGHAKTLYQELVHVPLIVKYPRGVPALVRTPVASIDVYPTVLDALGIAPPAGLEGVVLPRTEQARPPRLLFTETSRGRPQRAVRSGSLKLIERTRRATFELYDLEADPTEQARLGSEHPAFTELRESLGAWSRAVSEGAGAAVEVELSDEERAGLEALGYGGDDH